MAKKKIEQNERILEKNITSRCDGFSFRVRLTVRGVRINQTFDTLQDARAYRDRVRSDAATDPTHKLVLGAKQRRTDSAHKTFGDLLDRYLREITPTKRGAYVESTKIGKLKRFDIARLPIQLVGRDVLQQFVEQARRQEGWSDNNVRKYLMLVSGVFQTAVKCWGMTLDNPVRMIQVPGNGKARNRRLLAGEFEYLIRELRKARNPYAAPFFEFAIQTAARRGEILKLKRQDVDLEIATALLRGTKNGEDRVIPLSKRAIEICRSVIDSQNDLLFPLTAVQLRQAFDEAKKRGRQRYLQDCCTEKLEANSDFLESLRFHDLRREGASLLFEKNLNVMEVATITGHKTLAMLKTYTALRPAELALKLG